MFQVLAIIGWVFLGFVLGTMAWGIVIQYRQRQGKAQIAGLLKKHFQPTALDNITISQRQFANALRADLQRAIEKLFVNEIQVTHFCGVFKEYAHEGITLTHCVTPSGHSPAVSCPPQYEEMDVGEDQPIRVLKNGVWFLRKDGQPFVVLLAASTRFTSCGPASGMLVEIATANTPAGTQLAQAFFKQAEASVIRADSYRGKILSLEPSEYSYSGQASGIKVHKLRTVEREQVILPQKTLDLLDRNVIQFVRKRPNLARFRQATKKGLLFYGQPGTGKTLTIHYLAKAMPGQTTLIITAEQVGLLSEYMTLARLLAPSIVVLEDVDLIAKERSEMGVTEEVLLNKLLNEMDGLKEESDILFILTTNRPEALERALSSRPGRIDQAIEFPLPDEIGRVKLVRLYAQGVTLPDELVETIVRRTENVSPAFIKELMRRTVQFHLEHDGAGAVELQDVENAIEEILFSGGSLNLKLLGADRIQGFASGGYFNR